MGTSFDCAVTVSTHPQSGQLLIGIGPLDMGNLAEMLDYLRSDEAREAIIAATSRAFMADHAAEMGPVHLRGTTATTCGLPLWSTNCLGQRVNAVASVGTVNDPVNPVTCPDCKEWIARCGLL